MARGMAIRILTAAAAVEATIGELDMLISQLEYGKERDEYVSALGDVVGIISETFVRRIARQYPDLDPDR